VSRQWRSKLWTCRWCDCGCSSLSRVADVCPTLYQSQLKLCVTRSLDTSSSDVRQIADKISAIVENSSLGTCSALLCLDGCFQEGDYPSTCVCLYISYVCLFACLSLSQQDYSESMDEFLQCLPTTLVVEYVSFLYADNSLLMYLFWSQESCRKLIKIIPLTQCNEVTF